MNYKEEMDNITASDSLKKSIAALQVPKKHRGKRIAAIAAAIVIVLFAGAVSVPMFTKSGASCDEASYVQNSSAGTFFDREGQQELADDAYGFTSDSAAAASELPANRKLIRNAQLRVETKTFDTFYKAVLEKAGSLSGYVQSTAVSAYGNDGRYADVVLRIPSDSLDAFLQSVSELGNVTWQSTDIQDVTDEYVDMQSRITALETEQTTLLELLKKADSLTDVLEIQSRLTEVRSSLETWKGQFKALESQIDYSTVSMEISEVSRVTPAEQASFFGQVRQNLSENLYTIALALRNGALWFLSSLPYIGLVLIGLCLAAAVVVLVRRRKHR